MIRKNQTARLFGMTAALLLCCGMMTGCMGKKSASFSIQDSQKETLSSDATSANTSVTDKNGWKTKYDSTLFDMTHSGNDVVFTYIGEGGGTDVLTIGYVENKLPSEVLYDVTADVEMEAGVSRVQRSEGFFNADSGDWCYGRYIPSKGGKDPERAYTAVEHNGGTLLVSEVSTPQSDEKYQNECDAAIMDIRINFEWTNHQKQQEFSYVPGTYVRTWKEEMEGKETEVTDTVVMNEGHTGVLQFQDDISFVWSSFEIIEDESGDRYEYNIEGDILYVDYNRDGNRLEFQRKK